MRALAKAIVAALVFVWGIWGEIVTLLYPCRFSVLVVAAGGFVLLATGPGGEVVAGFRGRAWDDTEFLLFQAALLIWALNSWFWARYALGQLYPELIDPPTDGDAAAWRKHWLWYAVPRALGVAAYGTVIAAVAMYSLDADQILLTVAAGAVYLVFVWKRRIIDRRVDRRVQQSVMVAQSAYRSLIGGGGG